MALRREHSRYHNQGAAAGERGTGLAQAIVDTVREPLLILDEQLRVVAANRAFYLTFHVQPQDTQGRHLFALGDGQWSNPGLRAHLEKVLPERAVLESYEVEHEVPQIGRRIMLLNARKVFYEEDDQPTVLLAIEDVTQQRAAERALQQLLHQKELLLEEMQHRIANSLQIIASILMLKASTVQSEETRLHLRDAHARVVSMGTLQQHLHAPSRGELTAVAPYLSQLCLTLAQSMIGESRRISVEVEADGATVSAGDAISIGLIVTEGVINALKHAFPRGEPNGRIIVAYDAHGPNWKLSIADNGIGTPHSGFARGKPGLGTSIVHALAQSLDARVDRASNELGTTLSVSHTAVVSLRASSPSLAAAH
jgi:two-component sensor histidine kinase